MPVVSTSVILTNDSISISKFGLTSRGRVNDLYFENFSVLYNILIIRCSSMSKGNFYAE